MSNEILSCKIKVLTVTVLSSLLTIAQNIYCHGIEKGSDYMSGMDWNDSYAKQLTNCLGFPEHMLSSLLLDAKTEHTSYVKSMNFDLYGDENWADWYAEFMIPFLEQPNTSGDDSQFSS